MRKGLLLMALCTCVGRAGVLHVVQDTSLLAGHPAAPFYASFQFNDGSGTGNANNFITIDNFDFGGGAAGLGLAAFGGAVGSMDVGIQMTDSDFFNLLYQEFLPGATLSFDVHFTQVVEGGPQPDQWNFAILDCSLTELPTTSPSNALMSIDIAAPVAVGTFGGSGSGVLGCTGGPAIPLPGPAVNGIPEPGSAWLLLLGLPVLRLRRRRVR